MTKHKINPQTIAIAKSSPLRDAGLELIGRIEQTTIEDRAKTLASRTKGERNDTTDSHATGKSVAKARHFKTRRADKKKGITYGISREPQPVVEDTLIPDASDPWHAALATGQFPSGEDARAAMDQRVLDQRKKGVRSMNAL